MSYHKLKIWPSHYMDVSRGLKKAEVRFNDRDFKVGDLLSLEEFEPHEKRYTGQSMRTQITHILMSDALKDGYVVLSFGEIVHTQCQRTGYP